MDVYSWLTASSCSDCSRVAYTYHSEARGVTNQSSIDRVGRVMMHDVLLAGGGGYGIDNYDDDYDNEDDVDDRVLC